MKELIINFTPTGMIPTKAMTPHVPVSVAEIIDQVHEAYEVGITLVHLHAREEETGIPTYKKDVYALILEGLRKHCPDLVLCVSLSGRNFNTFEKRSQALELYPDMGSLTLSSLNFPRQASVNSPDMIQKLAIKMEEYGVHPELEIFSLGMVNYAKYLIKKNLLKSPYYFNLLFGNIAGVQPNLMQVGLVTQELPEDSYWSLAGIGSSQLQMNAIAIATGGGVRIGLEDNIYFDQQKKVLATNIDMVKRVHQLAGILERRVMRSETFGNLGFYNKNRK